MLWSRCRFGFESIFTLTTRLMMSGCLQITLLLLVNVVPVVFFVVMVFLFMVVVVFFGLSRKFKATASFGRKEAGGAMGVFVTTVIRSRLVSGSIQVMFEQAFGVGRQATRLPLVGFVALLPLSIRSSPQLFPDQLHFFDGGLLDVPPSVRFGVFSCGASMGQELIHVSFGECPPYSYLAPDV